MRMSEWEGSEPGRVSCASGVQWHPQNVGEKSEDRQTRKAVVTRVTLVLEVGVNPGASQGPERKDVSQT